MTSTPPQHPDPHAATVSNETGGAFDRAGRDRLRGGLPSLLLPRNPFADADPGTGVVDTDPRTAPDAGAGLPQFHQAVSDRRKIDRGTADRRSVARPYASPWMAGPDGGTVDPRPDGAPATDPRPAIVGPIATVMPDIPIPPAPAAPASASESAPTTAAAPPAVAAAPAAQPVAVAPSPQPVNAAPPAPVDLAQVFGMPAQVQAASVDPSAWFPLHAAPADAPSTPWPDPPAAAAGPWGDLAPTSALEPMAAPEPSESRRPGPSGPQLPAAPTPMPIATVPVSPPALPAPRPSGPDIAELQRQIAQAASPPASSLAPGATGQALSGSLLTRLFWMLGAPAAAGAGVGYLLSLVLR